MSDLQKQLTQEVGDRQAGDTSTLSAAKSYTDTTASNTLNTAAATAGSLASTAQAAAITTANGYTDTSVSNLSQTVATNLANGLATKADVKAPVQVVAALDNGACSSATLNQMVLLSTALPGQQLYICWPDPANSNQPS